MIDDLLKTLKPGDPGPSRFTELAAEVDLSACRPADGRAILHILEGTPADQVAAQKSWMTERSRPVPVAGGKARVVFPKRSVTILAANLK